MTLPKLPAKVSYDLSLNNNMIWAFIECYYHSTLQKFHLFLSISFQFKLIMAVKFLRRNCDIKHPTSLYSQQNITCSGYYEKQGFEPTTCWLQSPPVYSSNV